MRNVFLFIRRFFNFFFFLALQVICIALLVKYNKTYNALFTNASMEVTGRLDKQYNSIQYYFNLKEINHRLVQENSRLRNLLQSNFTQQNNNIQTIVDTLPTDTTKQIRKFIWLPAKVVNNSIFEENNFITLYRGRTQGVKENMAVISSEGIVGKVIAVSDNFCRVMSLLNRNSKVSGMLKKNKYTGIVDWNGESATELIMHNIPKSVQVKAGDTVVTSNLSGSFPEGLMIGTVQTIVVDPATNFYTLRLKTATNFYTLQYVYVVQNNLWTEQQTLEAQTPKQQ